MATQTTEGAAAVADSAEPSESDLLQILNTGNAPATRTAKPASAKADRAAIAAAEAEEDLDDDDTTAEDAGDETISDDAPAGEADASDGDEATDDTQATDTSEETNDGTEDGADEDTALDDEDREVRGGFTKEQQARFDKAVSKKTRRILELKTELREEQAAREAAEARAKDVEKSGGAARAVPTAADPLADIEDEAALDQKLTQTRQLRKFALANPDGAFVDAKGNVLDVADPENPPEGATHVGKKRIGELLAETEELLQQHGPARRAFLAQRATAEKQALADFPFLKDKKSQGYQAVEATLAYAPQLRSLPGIKHVLADAFIGRFVRMEEQKKAGARQPGAGTKKAPPSPGGAARPAKVDGKRKAAVTTGKTLADTGQDEGNAALRAIIGT